MKKIIKKLFYAALFFAAMIVSGAMKAQMPITVTSGQTCFSAGNNTATASVLTFSPSWTYSWTAITTGPATVCPVSQTNVAVNGSTINLNFGCCGLYTLNCIAYSGSSMVASVSQTYAVVCAPLIGVSSSPSSPSVCAGTPITLNASGAITYTWSNGVSGATNIVTPSVSTCYTVIGTTGGGCTGMTASCKTILASPLLSVSGPSTVCDGSSATLVASGASSYNWNSTPANTTATLTVTPTLCSQYTLTGIGSNGCNGMTTVFVCRDTTCGNVWPGDANSDGVVDNTDVLEIGLSYGMTGAARSPGGNAYTSQFASSVGWVGFGSTGKRKVHIDCNGDGTIDMGDTVAIFNNYSLTHSFKPSDNTSANSDISLSTPVNATEGIWNKADIMLGSSTAVMTNLYGVAFDINFDNAMIEANSAYIDYTSSFLNAANQNVQFRKNYFANGKIYAATVRTNGTDVSGDGKIGEFWFKVKTGLPANSVINISTSNSVKIGKIGFKAVLTNGTAAPIIVANTVGLKEMALENAIHYFPNPASNQLTLQSGVSASVNYVVYDVVGRTLTTGTFTGTTKIDISTFENGTYILRFGTNSDVSYKKLVIEK